MSFDTEELCTRQYTADVTIFEEGGAADEAFLIREGQVRVFTTVDGIEKDIAVMSEGDILGEMSLIKGDIHTCSAVALSRTTLSIITKPLLDDKITKSDPLIKGLVYMLIARLYKSNAGRIGAELPEDSVG